MQNSNIMNRTSKYAAYVLISIAGLFIVLGTYIRIWESRQPRQHIKETIVISITPYYHSNDLHLSSRGFKIYVAGMKKPINFPSKIWNHTLQEGDIVDAVFSQSFPWFGFVDEFDGLSVRATEGS